MVTLGLGQVKVGVRVADTVRASQIRHYNQLELFELEGLQDDGTCCLNADGWYLAELELGDERIRHVDVDFPFDGRDVNYVSDLGLFSLLLHKGCL